MLGKKEVDFERLIEDKMKKGGYLLTRGKIDENIIKDKRFTKLEDFYFNCYKKIGE